MRQKWLVGLVVGFLVVTGTGATAVPSGGPVQDFASSETVALLPVGEGRDQIGYSPDLPQVLNEGPQAFWLLDDGTIRVLDTVKHRVVDFCGAKFVREFPLPDGLEGQDLVVGADGLTYVVGKGATSAVLALDSRGQVVSTWPVPPEIAWRLLSLQPRADGAPLLACDLGEADLDSLARGGDWSARFSHLGIVLTYGPGRSKARLQAGQHAIDVEGLRNLSEVTVWGVDGEGNICITYCDMADASLVDGDILVCRYSPHGDRVGVANARTKGLWSSPCRWVFMARDGSIYLLRPRSDGVAIDHLTLGRRYESVINDVERRWRAEQEAFKQAWLRQGQSLGIPPEITRDEVKANCNQNIALNWTYNQVNAEPVPPQVTKPDWLAAITTYPKSLTGIPYCWGGFDSVNTAHSWVGWTNFTDAMAQGIFAGNVNCTGGYKSGTAGLDCAGFVSACAELGSHHSTYAIWDYESYPISDAERLFMDIYINRSRHVLFYYSAATGGINAKECCTDIGVDKCQQTQRSTTWLAYNGYSLRRLYVIDPEP